MMMLTPSIPLFQTALDPSIFAGHADRCLLHKRGVQQMGGEPCHSVCRLPSVRHGFHPLPCCHLLLSAHVVTGTRRGASVSPHLQYCLLVTYNIFKKQDECCITAAEMTCWLQLQRN